MEGSKSIQNPKPGGQKTSRSAHGTLALPVEERRKRGEGQGPGGSPETITVEESTCRGEEEGRGGPGARWLP